MTVQTWDAQQLALFDAGDGRETPRGREPAEVYAAAVALRDRGFAVRRAGRLHDVGGDLLDDAALLHLAAYWSERRGPLWEADRRARQAAIRRRDWALLRRQWLARPPAPRGQTLTRRRPYRKPA